MIPIIYENSACVVVNKPADMPAQRDFSRTPDMLSVAEDYLGNKAFLIHRLDRHVAGPVVIAKTKKAAANLNKQLTTNGFTKLYKAVVVHNFDTQLPLNNRILLEQYHMKDKSLALVINKEAYDLLDNDNKAKYKPVKLYYECLNTIQHEDQCVSILKIELLTGRFHQIRSQLKSVGLPILGDPKYGETMFMNQKYKTIGLQSISLKFRDPVGKSDICAEAEHFDGPFEQFK